MSWCEGEEKGQMMPGSVLTEQEEFYQCPVNPHLRSLCLGEGAVTKGVPRVLGVLGGWL